MMGIELETLNKRINRMGCILNVSFKDATHLLQGILPSVFCQEYFVGRNLFVRFVCIRWICLYGNIPHWRFIASDGKKCLYLSQGTLVKSLIINTKTVLQRG